MAKVLAPLFSFKASGKLANALVYFNWKGLNVIRSYVIPSNPQTGAQDIQRDFFRKAVAKIHATYVRETKPLVDDDKSAYALWGSTFPTPRTWFNQAVKNWTDTKVDDNEPVIFSGGSAYIPTHDNCALVIYLNEETPETMGAGKFFLGRSKTAMLKSKPGTITAGAYVMNEANPFTDLVAGVVYYWQFRVTVTPPDIDAVSGIYHFKAD